MKQRYGAAEATSRGVSRRVTRFGPLEFSGLPLRGSAAGKSGKFPPQPLGDQTSGDGLTDSPRCDFAHREVLGNRQAEQLRERPRARTDLHPELEYRARLLPEIVQSPPTLEIVKQGHDILPVNISRMTLLSTIPSTRLLASVSRWSGCIMSMENPATSFGDPMVRPCPFLHG